MIRVADKELELEDRGMVSRALAKRTLNLWTPQPLHIQTALSQDTMAILPNHVSH